MIGASSPESPADANPPCRTVVPPVPAEAPPTLLPSLPPTPPPSPPVPAEALPSLLDATIIPGYNYFTRMKLTTTAADEPTERESPYRPCTAFAGARRIGSGDLSEVALKAKQVIDSGGLEPVLIFDDISGQVIDVDYRGAQPQPEPEPPRRPGRPKLGVVAREVTLLPRHWDWLNSQPGGASVALRKLVEEARRVHAAKDRVRAAQEAAYRFMSALAGNEPGFEEALRALFAGKREGFEERIGAWPVDVRDHARKLATGAFPAEAGTP